jgi:transcriptional regulator with XRE-family HTH domain
MYPPAASAGSRPSTAELIKRARHAGDRRHPNFMPQPELAQMIGVCQAAVAHWETGRNTPTLANLVAIAKTLKVPTSELIPEEVQCPIVREPDTLNFIAIFETLSLAQRNAILITMRTIRAESQE